MSVVPYFFIRCLGEPSTLTAIRDDVAEIWASLSIREVHWGGDYLPYVEPDDAQVFPAQTPPLPSAPDGQRWFFTSTEIGHFNEPAESEIAKRLFRNPFVYELRVGYDCSLPGGIETVDEQHRLITRDILEFPPRSWMRDENGNALLDRDGKALPHLDFAHQRMALLAQAFGAVDTWLGDEQWAAVDEWLTFARLGGMG